MRQRWCTKCNYCWHSESKYPNDSGTCPDGSAHDFGTVPMTVELEVRAPALGRRINKPVMQRLWHAFFDEEKRPQ